MKRYTFTLEETQEIKAARKKNRDKNVEKRLAALEMRAEGKQNKEINKIHIPENIELFYIETVQPNSKPTIPASLPIKKGTQLQRLVHGQNRRQVLQHCHLDHGQHDVLRTV